MEEAVGQQGQYRRVLRTTRVDEEAFQWIHTRHMMGQEEMTRRLEHSLRGGPYARRTRRLVQARDTNGWTLLHYAAYYGLDDWVRPLLAAGADIHAVTPVTRYTPLHWAVKKRHSAAARELLQAEPDLGQQNLFEETPLADCEDEWRDALEASIHDGVVVRSRVRRWATVAMEKGRSLLASQVLQLVLRFFLILFLELLLSQVKRALHLMVLLVPANLPWVAIRWLFPEEVEAWLRPYARVVTEPVWQVVDFTFRPFNTLLQFYLVPFVQSWLQYLTLLWAPFGALFSALFSVLRFQHGFSFLWRRAWQILLWALQLLRLLPVINALLSTANAAAAALYESVFASSGNVLVKVADRLRPIITQQLEYRNLIAKLVYPLINGIGLVQNYVLPAWFLSLVEKSVRPIFGNALNHLDVALSMVLAVILTVEAFVALLGYLVKGLLLLYCAFIVGAPSSLPSLRFSPTQQPLLSNPLMEAMEARSLGFSPTEPVTCSSVSCLPLSCLPLSCLALDNAARAALGLPLSQSSMCLTADFLPVEPHLQSLVGDTEDDDPSVLDLRYMDDFLSCRASYSWLPDLFHHQVGMLAFLVILMFSFIVSVSGSLMLYVRTRSSPLQPLRQMMRPSPMPRVSSPNLAAAAASAVVLATAASPPNAPSQSPALMPARAFSRPTKLRSLSSLASHSSSPGSSPLPLNPRDPAGAEIRAENRI